MRTVGVEEELLIVDPVTGEPLALADALLAGHHEPATTTGLGHELKLEQIETQTRPCHSHSELLEQIRRGRSMANEAARRHGARIAAMATSPLASNTHTTPDPRYAEMLDRFGIIATEQLTCGFHVHVSVESPEEGVVVLDHIRDKLAVLTALTANSPYWRGLPTGFDSYRTQAWNRWPTSGPSTIFGSLTAYRRLVKRLLDTGVILDEGMIYFDARISRDHPTVEVRVADVCLRAEDAALIAVLVRALVETASLEMLDGVEPTAVPTAILRMASWQASNSGLRGDLLDFGDFLPQPAAEVVWALVDYLSPVLDDQGELELVKEGISELLQRGNGAREQREAADRYNTRRGDGQRQPGSPPSNEALAAVVGHAAKVTVRGGAAGAHQDRSPLLSRVRRP
ncbi:glutamate--cysteine ligase [Paenarthrobacter aurescens]|uniref:Putative glutamate--cysteine ligase 2 n=1 Tax=Paenarthrobacter aurescens TaxID=43663 RepID=A0A4Y3NA40_PAEAU|nr:glutamate--cysteine ligase [Paenarthrobacter aurescens]MDO6145079.1 glutamate--cysteine ligase [Paenarthrobacter aurescens]MDO6148924.1 glutamate--cysteine ligase [Paenarthrobacter aurescens]MDO6160170.1 glutamate--cysteine ligase [Paenarthrobacter aurescens]MDO6164029.1 glutamate--cysteine ligase [Paenarthrobacter aurescens]GEB17255.1 putative glutamate--cysteine ligase 2 [Paenarthrobacter aurescens]